MSDGLPRLVYVKAPTPIVSHGCPTSWRIEKQATYRRFRTVHELRRLVRDDLATLLTERFTAAPQPRRRPVSPSRRSPRRGQVGQCRCL